MAIPSAVICDEFAQMGYVPTLIDLLYDSMGASQEVAVALCRDPHGHLVFGSMTRGLPDETEPAVGCGDDQPDAVQFGQLHTHPSVELARPDPTGSDIRTTIIKGWQTECRLAPRIQLEFLRPTMETGAVLECQEYDTAHPIYVEQREKALRELREQRDLMTLVDAMDAGTVPRDEDVARRAVQQAALLWDEAREAISYLERNYYAMSRTCALELE